MPGGIVRLLLGMEGERLIGLLLKDGDIGDRGGARLDQPAPFVEKAAMQGALQIGIGGAAKLIQEQDETVSAQTTLHAVEIGDQLGGWLVGKDAGQRRTEVADSWVGLQLIVNGVGDLKVEIIG